MSGSIKRWANDRRLRHLPPQHLGLIGRESLLPEFFGEIVIPTAARDELIHAGAPVEVQRLMTPLPSWIKVLVAEPGATAGVEQLGQGERDAILIALKMTASLVFIDEAQGRKAAEKLGLIASGTRGILERAVRRSLIDGAETAARLKTAGFRASPRLLALLERPSAKPAAAHRKERSSS